MQESNWTYVRNGVFSEYSWKRVLMYYVSKVVRFQVERKEHRRQNMMIEMFIYELN